MKWNGMPSQSVIPNKLAGGLTPSRRSFIIGLAIRRYASGKSLQLGQREQEQLALEELCTEM
ncbi:MAG: hypothetical protein M3Y24_03950 [Acidobacteriota bacterium]|nr:hypothetical protein [Acidobacteriota bacterium]